MSEHTRIDMFTLDRDEIAVLLKLLGRESHNSIVEMGLDSRAFVRLWDTFTAAAYASLWEDSP